MKTSIQDKTYQIHQRDVQKHPSNTGKYPRGCGWQVAHGQTYDASNKTGDWWDQVEVDGFLQGQTGPHKHSKVAWVIAEYNMWFSINNIFIIKIAVYMWLSFNMWFIKKKNYSIHVIQF